ncbi:hypothetical protein [Nocardiopsis halophila]|uniref:hypothetical protein n=1 Tax=Nocardiopsis halophila TaxID=141692 RepID=UPI0003491F19|nr:hypothetical protein [Nocardiopsis halophila]
MSNRKPPRNRPGNTSTLVPNVEPIGVPGGMTAPAEPTTQPEPDQAEAAPTKAPEVEGEATAPQERASGPDASTDTSTRPSSDATQAAPTPTRSPNTSSGGTARDRLEASAMRARLQSREWDSHTVRLPEPLWNRLQERVERDQKAYGRAVVAMNHYLNAAFEAIPAAPTKAAKMAVEHQIQAGLCPPASRSSGTRLHSDVRGKLEMLPAQMRRIARPGLLGHLQAAALTRFLDELDELDQ